MSSEQSLDAFLTHVKHQYNLHGYVTYKWTVGNQRTRQQNKAMWRWLSLIADALNDAGFDMRKTLKPHIDIPWNKERAKEHLWNPIQEAMTDKSSSGSLSKQELSEVQEVIARHLAASTGVSVPFPTKHGE